MDDGTITVDSSYPGWKQEVSAEGLHANPRPLKSDSATKTTS